MSEQHCSIVKFMYYKYVIVCEKKYCFEECFVYFKDVIVIYVYAILLSYAEINIKPFHHTRNYAEINITLFSPFAICIILGI